ncbi:MurR/RpiR family transcriptional regulator, partial [Pantoea endophytica]
DYSSQQLASALGISQSSVVKFSQKLGFKGYPDLKYSIGQDVARAGVDPQQAPSEPDSGDDYLRLGDALRRSKAQAEEETRQANPGEEIERIVQLLDVAPKRFVVGLGDDVQYAREFGMRLSLIRLLVVPHTDPILMLA